MNICVFDTETTSLEKPFCYNIGYIIANDKGETLIKKEFICEQIWHNTMLFSTAYYANKRPIYVKEMRKRNIRMNKFGYICMEMIRDFNAFEVKYAFAYNSSFDEKVFNFNCEWFKCNNPFDNIPIYDIRGYAHRFIVDNEYKNFCEKNEFFSESLNYSTTAENVYRFISQNTDFIESHTALDDSIIEKDILFYAINKGAILGENYQAYKSIKRKVKSVWKIDYNGEITDYNITNIAIYKSKKLIKMKNELA